MMLELVMVGLFGLITGSFLNVCIHRMPLEQSVVHPGSHCPQCQKPIRWYDNIPVLSFILLGGRCRWCKARISFRYVIVELLTALVFVALFLRWGLSIQFLVYLCFLSCLIVATFVDIQHRIIPDEVSVGGMLAGLLLSGLRGLHSLPGGYDLAPLADSFLGALAGGGVIYATGALFDLVYFKLLKKPPIQGETSSMGGGDVKLLAMIGAFLGWQKALITFFIAPLFGVVVGVVNLVTKKDHTIAYGPFLALAAVVALCWADKILALVFFQY